MSVPHHEIKELAEAKNLIPSFNWETCPPKLLAIFQETVNSKSDSLDLSGRRLFPDGLLTSDINKDNPHLIADEDVPFIVDFLNAYPHITTLDLNTNNIGSSGAAALAVSTTIKKLNLSNNPLLGPQGAQAIAKSKSITTLTLNGCRIGDEGAKAFRHNTSITNLDLKSNNIGDEGAKALAEIPTLEILNLQCNAIKLNGVQYLAKSRIKNLNLSNNSLDNDSAKALATSENMTTLCLDQNPRISDTGIIALAKNKIFQHLMLCNCWFQADASIKALAENTTLITLDLKDSIFLGQSQNAVQFFQHNTTLEILDIRNLSTLSTFSDTDANTLLKWQHDRATFAMSTEKKLALLMGTQRNLGKKSSVLSFSNNYLYDKKLFQEIFSLAPPPLTLLHSFEPELVTAFANSLAKQKIQEEPDMKETKERCEHTTNQVLGAVEKQASLELAMAASIRELNGLLLSEPPVEDEPAVNFRCGSGSSSVCSSTISTASVPVTQPAVDVGETQEQKRKKISDACRKRKI